MPSTIPQAKVNLKALLEGHSWPVQSPVVRWGGPTESEDISGEMIYFGDTSMEIPDETLRLGRISYREEYDLRIVIDVLQYGDDEQSTEQRAWDLYWEVTRVLDAQANQTLNGAVNCLTGRSVRQVGQPLPQQWQCRIVIDQGCIGHIVNT